MTSGLAARTMLALDRLRVGLVEDNFYFRRIVRTMLGGFGIREVYEAGTVAEGWTVVQQQRPDVLLTDWKLEGEDGVALLDRIRRHPDDAIATQAFVFLSAHGDKRHVLLAAKLGANDFIAKPVSARILYDRLCRVCRAPVVYRRRAGRLVPVTAGEPRPVQPPPRGGPGRGGSDDVLYL